MGTIVQFTIKAPKLIEYLESLGVKVASRDGVFSETSAFTLPSGISACIFDEDAWGETLYGPEEMELPRQLHALDKSKSLIKWLFMHLSMCNEFDECEAEEDDQSTIFCEEFESILTNTYPAKEMSKKVSKLDDLIEEASFLYFDYWDGDDFNYCYLNVKNGEMSYWDGVETDNSSDEWYWRNLDEFIFLVKEAHPAKAYAREKSKWVEKN